MENNQRVGWSKYLVILVIVTIVSCYYVLNQANITIVSIQPYKSKIFEFIFYENSSTQTTEESFLKIHERIVLNRTENNVVFYRVAEAGYGNRLYNMLSAFLVAIISDSALLIDWPSIDNYIESPLVNVFTKFSDSSFLDTNQKSPQICTITTLTKNTWSFNKQLDFLQDLRIPDNCNRYYVSNITPYFFDLAANLKYAEKLVSKGFIQKQTFLNAKKALESNVSQNITLDSLFRIGFEFAGYALNNYWLLKPNVTEKINNFINQKFSGDFIIGLQMRFEYLNQVDIQTFINCALKIEEDNKNRIGNRKVKWFISTDQIAQIQNLSIKYTDRILTGEGKIGHVAFESDAYERAIIDIELLSHCNETILTGGSTFGFIGSLKSQKIPYFVEGKRNSSECKLLDFHAPARNPTGYSIYK